MGKSTIADPAAKHDKRQATIEKRRSITPHAGAPMRPRAKGDYSSMTLKELSQLYYLTREIEADQKRLDELEQIAEAPSGAQLTGMPRAPFSNSSKVERLAAEIVDLQAIIAARQIQCIHERARLERWIGAIPDSLTRQIFHYRFVDGLTWLQVALHVGGGNTEGSVKMICYRYIRTNGNEAQAE